EHISPAHWIPAELIAARKSSTTSEIVRTTCSLAMLFTSVSAVVTHERAGHRGPAEVTAEILIADENTALHADSHPGQRNDAIAAGLPPANKRDRGSHVEAASGLAAATSSARFLALKAGLIPIISCLRLSSSCLWHLAPVRT